MNEVNNSNLAIINKTDMQALIMELQYLDQEVLSKLTDKSSQEKITTPTLCISCTKNIAIPTNS